MDYSYYLLLVLKRTILERSSGAWVRKDWFFRDSTVFWTPEGPEVLYCP